MAHARTVKPLNEIYTVAEIAKARFEVNQVFNNAPDRHETIRYNCFTSGGWVPGLDPIQPQKDDAIRAVLARRWHAKYGPVDADLQPLPLGYDEREALKGGGAPHILAWYARSLCVCGYDVTRHPKFRDYACGVMASSPIFFTENRDLQSRFPPRQLSGLGSGLIWLPPGQSERCDRDELKVANDKK